MFQSLLNRINLENRLTVSIVGGFSIAFAIFLTIYVIILPSDKNFDTAKDSSLVDFVRLRKNDCEVKMYKDQLVKPKKIMTVDDTEIKVRGAQPRRVAKKDTTNVWIVEIKMPRRFVDEFSKEQVEAAEDSYIDMEAIQGAQDQSLGQPNTMPEVDPTATGLQEPGTI